jgi:predicted nuclease of predicted toxin-antitoxin system
MKFLANENLPFPSIEFLRNNNVDIISIAEQHPGISDEEVMEIAINDQRTIVTHDSDYGELIYKRGYKPTAGVVYLRIYGFEPEDQGKILLDLINRNLKFENSFTVISKGAIRQRSY